MQQPGQHTENPIDIDSPIDIPAGGWWAITRRAIKASQAHDLPMLAAGVAFFAFLSLFPTLIAALTLFGLIADPHQVAAQMQGMSGALPTGARQLIDAELTAVSAGSGRGLSTGLVISLLAALWTGSSGISHLFNAVNLAYDTHRSSGFLRRRALGFVLTLGAIVLVLVTLALIAVLPAALDHWGLGNVATIAVETTRWFLLVILVALSLAVVYRIAPEQSEPRFRWVSVGAAVATTLWVIGTLLFSVYIQFFSRYNVTYGALTGVIVLMLWLFLSCYIVLLGAEINRESQRQVERSIAANPPSTPSRSEEIEASLGPRTT